MTSPSPDLTEQLRRMVDALDRGDLTAGPFARAHLAGALDALDAQQTLPKHGPASKRPFSV